MFATYYHFQALTNLVLQMLRHEMTMTLTRSTWPKADTWDLFLSMRLYFETSPQYDELWRNMTEANRILEKVIQTTQTYAQFRETLRDVLRLAKQHRDKLPQRELGMVEQEDLDRFVQGRKHLYGLTPEPVHDVWTDEQRKAYEDKQAAERAKWFADKPARDAQRLRDQRYGRRVVMAYLENGRAVLQIEDIA